MTGGYEFRYFRPKGRILTIVKKLAGQRSPDRFDSAVIPQAWRDFSDKYGGKIVGSSTFKGFVLAGLKFSAPPDRQIWKTDKKTGHSKPKMSVKAGKAVAAEIDALPVLYNDFSFSEEVALADPRNLSDLFLDDGRMYARFSVEKIGEVFVLTMKVDPKKPVPELPPDEAEPMKASEYHQLKEAEEAICE